MQLTQKSLLFKTTFEFGDEELTYTFTTPKKKEGGSIPYYKIPYQVMYTKRKQWRPLFVAIFCVVACLIVGAYSLCVAKSTAIYGKMSFLQAPALGFIVGAFCSRSVGISTIAAYPPIRVLDDKQRAVILDEIWKRRRDQMKRKLAQVNFDKPYYEELQKFNRLREQDIISEQEYQYARQKIAAMRDKAVPSLPGEIRIN